VFWDVKSLRDRFTDDSCKKLAKWECKGSDGTEQAVDYTFSYGNGNENQEWETGCFVHKRIIPAVKSVEFVSVTMSYTSRRWRCDPIVLYVHARAEGKTNSTKVSFWEELERVFGRYPKKCRHNIMLGEFSALKKNTESLIDASEEAYPEVNTECRVKSWHKDR
jgi:hypothetical protein